MQNDPPANRNKLIPFSDEEWSQLKDEIVKSFVPRNTTIDSRPFEAKDFTGISDNVKACFNKLDVFSSVPPENLNTCLKSRYTCVIYALIFCGEHSSVNVWTNKDIVELSNTTLPSILSSCECETLDDYLVKKDDSGVSHAENVISALLPKLSREEWKYYPSITCCFSWLLRHVHLPHMKHLLHSVLPITLSILGDYATLSKQIGLECLYHILTNVSSAELQWHIQLELLQDIIKRLLYYRDCELIILVTKCALELAEKSQPTKEHTAINIEWSFYDEILNIVLPIMEFEQNIERREIYGENLYLIVKSLNVSAVRWLPRILRIIEDYSKTTMTEKHAMKALNACLRWCWPIVEKHWRRINVIAGKIIFNSNDNKAISEAEICIESLKEIIPKDAQLMDVQTIKSRRR